MTVNYITIMINYYLLVYDLSIHDLIMYVLMDLFILLFVRYTYVEDIMSVWRCVG